MTVRPLLASVSFSLWWEDAEMTILRYDYIEDQFYISIQGTTLEWDSSSSYQLHRSALN